MGKTSKVVVCGMKGVGKTTILEQVIYGNVTPSTVCLIFSLIYFDKCSKQLFEPF